MVRTSSSTSVSAARWLLGVISGVVLLFVLATAISQHIDSAIAGRANAIISNAMPSIQMLSATRGELRDLENTLERYEIAPTVERATLRKRISAIRENITATLATYAALPFFPDEPSLYERARRDLEDLDQELAAFLASADESHVGAVHHSVDAFDESIHRITTFDAAQGQRLGLEIERTRGQTRAAAVLLDAASVALAIVAVILALRQLRRAARAHEAERLARERREAELASQNEALGQFAGRVAHDILSPLSAASLSLDLARYACAEDPAAQRTIQRGSSAIMRVQTLVDGLLAFSRAGGRRDPGASAALRTVIPDLIAELRAEATEQKIDLVMDALPDGAVACSSAVLTSLISNLVRNAVKYMERATERRVELRVRAVAGRWRFEIEDTGPGIPADQQARIFEPYVQLDRHSSGIGLGLATVDRLVRAHDGSLGLISPVPGASAGSLFWFELPQVPAAEPVRDADGIPLPSPS